MQGAQHFEAREGPAGSFPEHTDHYYFVIRFSERDGYIVVTSGTSDMGASRPEGTVSSLTLRMPASWSGPLAGATVDLPKPWGEGWHVVGDPQPLDPALLHGCPFNVTAEVTRANG